MFYRNLQRDLMTLLGEYDQCYETPCQLSPAAIEELG